MQHSSYYHRYLGYVGAYYSRNESGISIYSTFSDAIQRLGGEPTLDLAGVVQIINRNFLFADRTLVQGLFRAPWMAALGGDSEWEFSRLPDHGESDVDEEEVAETLFEKLCAEVKSYVSGRRRVALLLSGGMDSRIVAGVLDYLIKEGDVVIDEVLAITWGEDDSRDVVYASQLAQRFGWRWKHYKVDQTILARNIDEAALFGAEYSPVHLHALPAIRDDLSCDCVLAGSFGDSIGRAEYSGRKVVELSSLSHSLRNVGGMLISDFIPKAKLESRADIGGYRCKFPRKKEYQQLELDYQIHYMRRMLNPCMSLLSGRAPVFQVFTAPEVFGYMWSLHPSRRNDFVYKHMLRLFRTEVSDIPWARTGLLYGENGGRPDSLKKKHHIYDSLIRGELFDQISSLVLSPDIFKLQVFNMASVRRILYWIRREPSGNIWFEEKLIWMAALARMVQIYGVRGFNSQDRRHGWVMRTCEKFLSYEYLLKTFSERFRGIR